MQLHNFIIGFGKPGVQKNFLKNSKATEFCLENSVALLTKLYFVLDFPVLIEIFQVLRDTLNELPAQSTIYNAMVIAVG